MAKLNYNRPCFRMERKTKSSIKRKRKGLSLRQKEIFYKLKEFVRKGIPLTPWEIGFINSIGKNQEINLCKNHAKF